MAATPIATRAEINPFILSSGRNCSVKRINWSLRTGDYPKKRVEQLKLAIKSLNWQQNEQVVGYRNTDTPNKCKNRTNKTPSMKKSGDSIAMA